VKVTTNSEDVAPEGNRPSALRSPKGAALSCATMILVWGGEVEAHADVLGSMSRKERRRLAQVDSGSLSYAIVGRGSNLNLRRRRIRLRQDCSRGAATSSGR